MTRTIVTVSGIVQGVGFRYSVLRIAARHAVAGTVRNVRDGERVEIDAEGEAHAVAAFVADVLANPPAGARIDRVDQAGASPRQLTEFSFAPTV
jgi:acylphosphatase